MLFVSSPLFDVVNNYLPFALGRRNDFHAISTAIGRPWTQAMGLGFAVAAAWVLRAVLTAAKRQPESMHVRTA